MVVVAKQRSQFGTDNSLYANLLYQGEGHVSSEDLMYLRPRYYSPDTGQFNKVDPFSGNFEDPQSLHKYAYVHGDPVNNIDPSGEFIFTLTALYFASAITAKLGLVGLAGVVTATALADALTVDFLVQKYQARTIATGQNIPATVRSQVFAEYLNAGTVASAAAERIRIGSPPTGLLPKNSATLHAAQGMHRTENRAGIGRQFVGTNGCGPCVGVVIVTPTQMHAFHFDAQDDPYATMKALGPFPAGSRAVITQALNEESAQARRTLGRVVAFLEYDDNIALDGFVGAGAVWVDNQGKYFTE